MSGNNSTQKKIRWVSNLSFVTDQLWASGADHFHTLSFPVLSPVKNNPLGPIWIAFTSSLENILPLSLNLCKTVGTSVNHMGSGETSLHLVIIFIKRYLRWQIIETHCVVIARTEQYWLAMRIRHSSKNKYTLSPTMQLSKNHYLRIHSIK